MQNQLICSKSVNEMHARKHFKRVPVGLWHLPQSFQVGLCLAHSFLKLSLLLGPGCSPSSPPSPPFFGPHCSDMGWKAFLHNQSKAQTILSLPQNQNDH